MKLVFITRKRNYCKKNPTKQYVDKSHLNTAELLETQKIWLVTIILDPMLYFFQCGPFSVCCYKLRYAREISKTEDEI